MSKCLNCGRRGSFIDIDSSGICSICRTQIASVLIRSSLTITTEFSSHYVEVRQKTHGLLSRVYLDGYQSLSGGYINYARFYILQYKDAVVKLGEIAATLEYIKQNL